MQCVGLFCDFQCEGGCSFWLYVLFEVLQEYFYWFDLGVWGWMIWLVVYQDVDGVVVEVFVFDNEECIEFFEYL